MNTERNVAVKVISKAAVCIALAIVIGRCATYFDSKWLLLGLLAPFLMYFGI